jgi:hypothetical protein
VVVLETCTSPEKTDTHLLVFLGVCGVGLEGQPSISVNLGVA